VRERPREKDLGREGEKHTSERNGVGKMAWVDFDHWSKSTTPANVC